MAVTLDLQKLNRREILPGGNNHWWYITDEVVASVDADALFDTVEAKRFIKPGDLLTFVEIKNTATANYELFPTMIFYTAAGGELALKVASASPLV